MNRSRLCLMFFSFLSVLSALAGAVPAVAQLPPDGDWATRTTEHLRVTYPRELPDLGARAAVRAEAAYRLLSEGLVEPPEGPIDIVVTDHTDIANGRATVFPTNRTVVVASPPMDGLSLAHFDDWLDLVLVHELAHVFHLDEPGGLGGIVRTVFGRVPVVWPSFPGLATPSWTREGLATWYESNLTSAGRNRGSYFEMVLRTAALEGGLEELDQASGSSPVWPDGDRPYIYGGRFFQDQVQAQQGRPEETRSGPGGDPRPGSPTVPGGIPDFVHGYADRWIPFRLSASWDDAFGDDAGAAWDAWRSERREEAAALRDSLAARAPLTRSEELVRHGRWALRPLPAPRGEGVGGDRIAYTRSDGRSDPQIHLLPEGRKLTRTSGLADFSWTPDGEIVFAQLEYTDRYDLRSDLHRVDAEGRVSRITEGGRLDHPHVAPAGDVAVAIQWGEGTNRLVEVDLREGAIRPLTGFDPDVHWAYPRVSPDGRWIAASRWSSGAFYDVVLLDRDGALVREVTRDRAVDVAPTWSPDGRWLLWSSDRTGIWNVLALPLGRIMARGPGVERVGGDGPGRGRGASLAGSAAPASVGAPLAKDEGLVQLTNVVTGALHPAVDPEGRWLYFSGYHADGWRIERIPFEPENGLKPFPGDRRVLPPGEAPVSPVAGARPDSIPGSVEAYSPVSSLLPRYWLPDLAGADEALSLDPRSIGSVDVLATRVGARTSGEDLLGRHSYSLRVGLTTREGRFEGLGRYRYAGLGNPVLGLSGYQDWDADPRFLRVESGGVEEYVVPVDRERGVGLSVGFLRRRYRDVLGLTLSGSYVRQNSVLLSRGPDGVGELGESRLVQPLLPDRDLVDVAATLRGSHTRRHPFSISPEDGIRASVTVRRRWDVGLPAAYEGALDVDRSFTEAVGELRLYKAFGGPGFANHVFAARMSGGVADGPDALAFHFELGGSRGRPETLSGFGLYGGESSTFPVRGFAEGARFGRYAWSGSLEYRFPLWLIHQGLGVFPLHFDRMSGSLFLDGGNAWGPEVGTDPVLPFRNPRRESIASAGFELSTIVLPFWTGDLTVRTGVAVPLRGPANADDASIYVRLGAAF